MGIIEYSAKDMERASIEALGLDGSSLGYQSIEFQSCSLRRAASFLCPCSERTLIHAVTEPLQGLMDDLHEFRRSIEETLETLVSHGDLLELSRTSQTDDIGTQPLLFLAPPAYVRRKSGAVMLLGGLTDNVTALPKDVEVHIDYSRHVRMLPSEVLEGGAEQLREFGYIELPASAWSKAPQPETTSQHLARVNRLLDAVTGAGEIQGLQIVDPDISTKFYRDRWVQPRNNHKGRYIGRRPRAYGADIWCYLELANGNPVRLIDLPLKRSIWRGCDEAWRIQAAIDCEQGKPQVVRLRSTIDAAHILDFFAPVPMWVTRRLETIGTPIPSAGSLFSYLLPDSEVAEEVRFLRDFAWIEESH